MNRFSDALSAATNQKHISFTSAGNQSDQVVLAPPNANTAIAVYAIQFTSLSAAAIQFHFKAGVVPAKTIWAGSYPNNAQDHMAFGTIAAAGDFGEPLMIDVSAASAIQGTIHYILVAKS